MKKLTIITFILLSGFFGSTVIKAQGDDLFSAMEEHLTNDEKRDIKSAFSQENNKLMLQKLKVLLK